MSFLTAPIASATAGVACFALGAWLRFQAAAVAGAAQGEFLAKEPTFGSMAARSAASARSLALYDVALPLLWCGVVLVVLAAAYLLLAGWRSARFSASDSRQPAPILVT